MKINPVRLTKISVKLTLIYAVLFSLVLVLLSAFILYGIKYFLIQQDRGQVETAAGILTAKIKDSENGQIDLLDNELVDEIKLNDNIYVRIADLNGNILSSSGSSKADAIPTDKPLGMIRKFETDGRHLLYMNNAITVNGKTTAYLQVVKNMRTEYGFIRLLFVLMGATDAVGVIVSLFAGYLIAKRMLKPIDAITSAAESISIHDLNKRIDTSGPDDELTRLAGTFNKMIERLQASFERQNQFVTDASHELRTPVSVIQGYANLIDRWGKDDRKVLQESINAIKNESEGMSELIERLLFLARSDCGRQELEAERFQMAELVNELVNEYKLMAFNRKIESKKNDPVEVNADRRMIKQMFRAVLDNAAKYTSEGGSIDVSSEVNGEKITVSVRDDGIGIPEKDIRNVFDRFYRVDKARSEETGGSGLGLPIVKCIAELHGGSVTISSAVGKGTEVSIILPKAGE